MKGFKDFYLKAKALTALRVPYSLDRVDVGKEELETRWATGDSEKEESSEFKRIPNGVRQTPEPLTGVPRS